MSALSLDGDVGRVLGGRYRLLAPIGVGSSAAVYLADDITLRRRVAVRVHTQVGLEELGIGQAFRFGCAEHICEQGVDLIEQAVVVPAWPVPFE